MKRDLDLFRELLFRIESGELAFQDDDSVDDDTNKIEHHLHLLSDAGFILLGQGYDDVTQVDRLTNAGHDFLDSVRKDTVWNRTKKTAKETGIGAIKEIGAIALAYGLAELKSKTGLDLTNSG